MKTIRKITLQVGGVTLLALIAWNGYLAVSHLRQLRRAQEFTVESSVIQANIAAVLRDMTDMETGQRGYLLTAQASYLEPYSDAKGRIANDFARLSAGSKDRTEHERSLELQLESAANSKQVEMERAISLRQQGYRRRAFRLVDSGEGKEYMDKVRELVSSLSTDEGNTSAEITKQSAASLSKARTTTIITNSGLLVITACLLWLARYHGRGLEKQATQSREELELRDLHLQKLTSTLSHQARFKTSAIETNACLLLEEYGGFLPRMGHECAEQIKEAAAQMERLRQDLVGNLDVKSDEQPVCDSVA
jgi:CHASE3 domain sensor protein